MKKIRHILSLVMAFVLVFSSMTSAYAEYYDDYAKTTNTTVSNICQQQIYYWDQYSRSYKTRNTIRFVVNWNNVSEFSFNNENWYSNGNQRSRTFNIREDYYDKSSASGSEVVLPKSVNVLFLYVKEYNSSAIKVFQYKLSDGDLRFIYGSNPVPTAIISVTDAIDLLPAKANFQLSDEAKLKAARAAYDALGVDKIWVYNAHKLFALETRLDELKTALIDWTKVYTDLDNENPGKITEQYYVVPNVLYADLYVQADKTKIFQTKYGVGPRYNNATISKDVLKDTTVDATKAFFTYDFSHSVTKGIYSPAMAKKVWGFFTPVESGSYQFKITSDDGHNWVMYLDDGQRLQDSNFKIQDYTTTITSAFNLHNISDYTTSNFSLKANTPYPLYMEYFNHGGNAALKMSYRITRDNGTVSAWTDMQGSVFKPSKAFEFGFKSGNAAELQKAVNEAQGLKDTYNVAQKIGTLEGQVSQAALNALIAKLDAAKIELQNAIEGKRTQAQIDAATAVLKAAIEEFKNAIVKKPNGISAPFAGQMGNKVIVEFNKDLAVNTYEIILSTDNTISNDDQVFSLTNANFVLNNASKINVTQGSLSGTLERLDTANGKYSFAIPIDAYMSAGKVNVFIRTATGDNKGDASQFFIGILETPKFFNYSVSDDNVIFYTVDKVGDTGFAIDYYGADNTLKRGYMVAKDKDYYVVAKNAIDLSKIAQSSLYRIKISDNTQNFKGGSSIAKTNPTKLEIPNVKNLKLAIANGQYTLNWDQFDGALSYEIYQGSSADTSKMIKMSENTLANTLNISSQTTSTLKYYAVKAIVANDQFSRSEFSNVVRAVKPSAPVVLKYNNEARSLTPPDKTNYVIKGDGTTKGYYLVTLPIEYLDLESSKNITESTSGTFVASFPEAPGQANIKYAADLQSSHSKMTSDDPAYVVYKVPYDQGDVGITIKGMKHKQLQANLKNVSIVKYVTEDGTTIDGISDASNINLKVEVTRPDISQNVEMVSNSLAKIVNDEILTMIGSEFEITYRYQINAEAVYSPNFVYTLDENSYFGFDYPTIKVTNVKDGVTKEIAFHTAVEKDSANNKTIVTVIVDDDTNFNQSDLLVTLKIKPLVKKGTDLTSLATKANLFKDSEEWMLPYVVESITTASKVSVMEGLKISNFAQFDTFPNSISAKKENTTETKSLKLKFKNKSKIGTSF